MKKFEYKELRDWIVDVDLNSLGSDGWELVSVFREKDDGCYYTIIYIFKREIK
mgnify:CR=1 FL=1